MSPVERPPPQRVAIVIPFSALAVVLAFALLVFLAVVSFGTLLSIFLAAVLAFGLDPPTAALVRRGWGRARASLVLFAALFVSVVALVILAAGPVWNEIVDFVNKLPEYWQEITEKPGFESWISTAGADDQLKKGLQELAKGLPEAASVLLGAAGSVFGGVLSLVTLTFLSLFLLMERPTITNWIQAVSTSLIGNVAISLVAATVAGLSAWAFGLPFPIVLAVITGLLDLIPQVGATVAAVILVGVALTVSTPAAIGMLVIQLIYQQVENYIVYPIVYRKAVALSPFTTIAAVLIAGAILGVVGAILAVPFAAVIKTVLREASAPRRARMAAMREAPGGASEPG
jgi:predicted PurR-regulated permease PerM